MKKTKKNQRHKKDRPPRDKVPYPALNPKYMPKVRQEYLDIDYYEKLSPSELEWLNRFVNEELNASFTNTDADIIQDPDVKKEIYNNNNARNRCAYGIAKAQGKLDYCAEIGELDVVGYLPKRQKKQSKNSKKSKDTTSNANNKGKKS